MRKLWKLLLNLFGLTKNYYPSFSPGEILLVEKGGRLLFGVVEQVTGRHEFDRVLFKYSTTSSFSANLPFFATMVRRGVSLADVLTKANQLPNPYLKTI